MLERPWAPMTPTPGRRQPRQLSLGDACSSPPAEHPGHDHRQRHGHRALVVLALDMSDLLR